ncbi:MAG TPA: peptidoglycan-binding domain-containing protein [Xanthobacteraceae bacterium]|nr:peptidoglycan-binding domain-containing protein [Xanthobacteraceae bacterium]
MPSYRNSAAAAVMDDHPDYERSTVGLFLARLGAPFVPLAVRLWRTLSRRPLDSLGFILGSAAAGAILINALFMQASPHPAPMLPGKPRPVALDATASIPARPRTSDRHLAAATPPAIPMPLARPAAAPQPSPAPQPVAAAPARHAIGGPARHAAAAPAAHPVSPTPVANPPVLPSRRIVAVQRALADFGYGQLKPNGIVGVETTTAIERFERERKLPVTGQISDRLVRELAAVTGRPLE